MNRVETTAAVTHSAIARENLEKLYNEWRDDEQHDLFDVNNEWWGILDVDDTFYHVEFYRSDNVIRYNIYDSNVDLMITSDDVIESGTVGKVRVIEEEYIFNHTVDA